MAKDEMVWAIVGHGRKRRMTAAQAKEQGLEIDTSPGRGFGGNGFGGANYRLSEKEKRSLRIQTGRDFETMQQFDAWCKVKGRRRIEKGESIDESWNTFKEWTEAGQPGSCPLPSHPVKERPDIDMTGLMERIRNSGEMKMRMERLGLGSDPDKVFRIPVPDQKDVSYYA